MGHGFLAFPGQGVVDTNEASLASIQASQIRTLDAVSFNAAETAYASGNAALFRVAVDRMRPGYRPAVKAWLAMHPLENPKAPPDPCYLPQYGIPQQTQARGLNARADAYFGPGASGADTADKYVRLTVLLAAVLFLVGIGSRFPARGGRYGLIGVAGVLLLSHPTARPPRTAGVKARRPRDSLRSSLAGRCGFRAKPG